MLCIEFSLILFCNHNNFLRVKKKYCLNCKKDTSGLNKSLFLILYQIYKSYGKYTSFRPDFELLCLLILKFYYTRLTIKDPIIAENFCQCLEFRHTSIIFLKKLYWLLKFQELPDIDKWRSPSLVELTSMTFNMGLTHLGS